MIQDQTGIRAGLLDGVRVLDLCDEQGLLCGRLLADLGAEVIAVEPTGGNPARRIGPFFKDVPDPERSLFWFAYAMNKKGITLNIESQPGKAILEALLRRSDVLVTSFPPGRLDRLGLGPEALARLNPSLIVVSITPFGEQGPYRDFKGSDLVHWALGGMLYLCGDADRPPVRISFPQSYLHAGAQAAIGAITALYHREYTGEGQEVSVAVGDCIPPAMLDALAYGDMVGADLVRTGTSKRRVTANGIIDTKMVFPCKDGYVVNMVYGGITGAASNREVSEWMAEEGIDDSCLKPTGWPKLDFSAITQAELDQVAALVADFLARHSKAELYDYVVERRPSTLLAPVNSPRDVWHDRQHEARGYWLPVAHDELDAKITYPGPWAVVGDGPGFAKWRRAPRIGEHNEEVFGQMLGHSKEDLLRLQEAGVI